MAIPNQLLKDNGVNSQINRLRETAGGERADKGKHQIHEYWQNYVREVYEKSLKEKHLLKPADVVREV